MLFELSEVQKQESLVDNLQESRKNIQDRLIRSYSANQKHKSSLQDKFSSMIKQSALLIHLLRQIDQSVQHKNLLPSIFNQRDINKLVYSTTNLPEWFDHVFSKEYEKEKNNLETIGNKMYKLHGLGEKNSQLVKAYWNMEILMKRYEILSEKQLQSLDIIQEAEDFQYLYKSCKEIFKNFLDMMVKKVLQFLQNTVHSTMLYSNQLKKVKSFDDRGFRQVLTSNVVFGPQSPRSTRNEISNVDSQNTVKAGYPYRAGQMGDYYIADHNSQVGKAVNNNSTVESLRQRQKANNQYFYRQAQQKNNHLGDNSITREIIKSARSYNKDTDKVFIHSPSQNYSKKRQESKDSSIRSARNYYDESIALKKYKSSTNLHQAHDTSLSRKYPIHDNSKKTLRREQIQQNKPEARDISGSKSHKCLHHCPHHDKPLNKHCSKHCNKLCQHEKMLFNDFGVDLAQMNRQYYQSRHVNSINSINSARSMGLQSPRGKQRSTQRDMPNVYSRRQKNLAQNNPYLRNSHDKHEDYYHSRSPMHKENIRFAQENIRFAANRQSHHIDNKRDIYIQKQAQFEPMMNRQRFLSPPVHASEYYYS